MGPLRTFRIGAVLQERVRRRSSWAESMRDRSRERPSAVVGRKGEGQELVRCRIGPSHGLSYREHWVPGIREGSRGLLGGWRACCVTANAPSAERASGVGVGFRQGGWDGISRENGIASRAPACRLRSAIAKTASRPARTTRGWKCPILTLLIPEIRRAPGFKRKGRPRQFDYCPSARRCTRDIDGVGPLRGFD